MRAKGTATLGMALSLGVEVLYAVLRGFDGVVCCNYQSMDIACPEPSTSSAEGLLFPAMGVIQSRIAIEVAARFGHT